MTDQVSVEKSMQFYCSYCLLTGTEPKTVRLLRSVDGPSKPAEVVSSDSPLLVGSTVGGAIGYLALSCEDIYDLVQNKIESQGLKVTRVEECDEYIVLDSHQYRPIRIYKHSYKTVGLVLASMMEYSRQKWTDTDFVEYGTICYVASRKVPTMSFESMFVFLSISYDIPEGKTISTITPEDIVDVVAQRLELSGIEDDPLELIDKLHPPNGVVPRLDPYTHHGPLPDDYKRIWSFIHCFRGTLPQCLFGHVCREIGLLFFLLAERHIEEVIQFPTP